MHEWPLEELLARTAEALGAGQPATDGRVREVPDRRTLRYYTTLGLLARPRLRGRTALYGRLHLLQLVAIKRLQARGLSLAEIQHRLLGLTESELAPLAGLTVEEESPQAAPEPEADFWKEVPSITPSPEALRLTDGLVLLLEPARSLRDDDRAAIRAESAALVELLRTRGLLPTTADRNTSEPRAS